MMFGLFEHEWNVSSIIRADGSPKRIFRCGNWAVALLLACGLGVVSKSSWAQAPGQPGPMVEISAKVFEFRYDTETQFGIFYQFNERDSGSYIADSDIFLPGVANPMTDVAIRALDLTGSFARINYGNIDFNVKAALQEGWGTVINNPTLITADGKTASIHSGESIPYTEVEFRGNQTNLRLQRRQTGVSMAVTPYILPKDRILLDLQISNNEVVRFEVFTRSEGQRYELPVISTRRVRTVVILPSGQRLYIGGLWSHNTSDITRKVPIIGDMPGLGFFFRGFNKKVGKSETLFQIIPTIRSPGVGLESQLTAFDRFFSLEDADDEIVRQQGALRSFSLDDDAAPPPPGPPPAFLQEGETGVIAPGPEVEVEVIIPEEPESRERTLRRRTGKAHIMR